MSSELEHCLPSDDELAVSQSINESVLQELKGIMGDDFPSLIETYLTSSLENIKNIGDAIKEKDAEALMCTAHAFKGSNANLGLEKLVLFSQSLEIMGRTGNVSKISEEVYQQMLVEYQKVTIEIKGYL
ncbi:hypothetical protein MNBD_GAMMA16-34 [hydrothermal vent metagenome]|uniref:HPt domain-containing protein n=1 Tax=hydrothermal vent metagenome TaxID=652676 RepID=A0A3B0ZVZ1_9ZZZZ